MEATVPLASRRCRPMARSLSLRDSIADLGHRSAAGCRRRTPRTTGPKGAKGLDQHPIRRDLCRRSSSPQDPPTPGSSENFLPLSGTTKRPEVLPAHREFRRCRRVLRPAPANLSSPDDRPTLDHAMRCRGGPLALGGSIAPQGLGQPSTAPACRTRGRPPTSTGAPSPPRRASPSGTPGLPLRIPSQTGARARRRARSRPGRSPWR